MRFKYKYEVVPAIIYLLISLAASIPVYIFHAGALSGVYLSLLSKPWSSIGFDILDSMYRGVKITDSMYLLHMKYDLVVVVVSVLINAIIIFLCSIGISYYVKSK